MSVYLVRTLLLSLGISLFTTVCFHVLREDIKLPAVIRFSDPKPTYAAEYKIRAIGFPAEPGLQQSFKNSLQVNIASTTERLDKAGFEGKVDRENDSTYKVSVRNITDTNSIRQLLEGNGSISFNEVYSLAYLLDPLKALDQAWPQFAKEKVVDTLNGFSAMVFKAANPMEGEYRLKYYLPNLGYIDKKYSGRILAMLADSDVARTFPHNLQFAVGKSIGTDGMSVEWLPLYALKKNTSPITHRNIKEATVEKDHEDNPYISLIFDAAGARRWEKMTGDNVGKAIAISVDNEVIVAPNVMSKIIGGNSRISMSGEENCRILSVLLISNELKLPARIIQSQVKREGKFSPKVLTGYINYILLFILSFVTSFFVIWFVFKPGKKLSRNA